MSQIRKSYSKQFKAQVALSAIREEDSISSLSSKYGVHPTQINAWRRKALSTLADLFDENSAHKQSAREIDALQRKIGQLTMEQDFLLAASNRLASSRGKK